MQSSCPARHSNLGGVGPSSGPEFLLFTRVGLQPNGRPFDLMVTAREDEMGTAITYASDLPALNGCSSSGLNGQETETGPLGQIRVKAGEAPAATGECPGYLAGRTGYRAAKNGKCALNRPPGYPDPPSEVINTGTNAEGCRLLCDRRVDCGGFTVRADIAFTSNGVDATTYECHLFLAPPEEMILSRLTQAPKEFRGACCMIKDERRVSLTFAVVDSLTGQPITLPSTYLSFLDIDGGTDADIVVTEAVTVYGASSHVLSDQTLLRVATRDDGGVVFASDIMSANSFDPTDPLELSDQQARCTVTLHCRDFSTLRVDLTVRAPDGGGRTFYFAGLTSLLPRCSPTPSPPPVPLLPPLPPPTPPPPPPLPGPRPYQCQCILTSRCACIEEGVAMTSAAEGGGLAWEDRFRVHYQDAQNNGG